MMPTTPDAGTTRELARMCAEEDELLCATLHVRVPNLQALHDAKELARRVATGEAALEPGSSLGSALREIYNASIEDQEIWGYAVSGEAPIDGRPEISEPSR